MQVPYGKHNPESASRTENQADSRVVRFGSKKPIGGLLVARQS